MNTKEKFGLEKPKAVALFVQLIFVLLATVCTAYVLGFCIISDLGALMIINYSSILLSYVAVIFYAARGYKKADSYYLGAVYAFCAAIFLNILLPFRSTYQLVVLIALFGLYVAFAQRLKQIKIANCLLASMLVFAVAFSVYSTITAKTETLGELANFFSVSAMYISVWTPVIMTVTLALAYNVRNSKQVIA